MDPETAPSARLLTFDDDADTIIILPYFTESSTRRGSCDEEASQSSHGDATDEEAATANDAAEPSELRLKVSKKHLVAASRRARAALSGKCMEADTRTPDGLHRWTFEPFFEPEAFEMVMSILHGRTKMIPRQVTLRMLADVAAVVDDLRCEEATWFFAKSWIHQLETAALPRDICDDLARWIMVSSVFHEPEIFLQCTKTAILHSSGPLPTAGLPIRPPILDSIEARRRGALDDLLSQAWSQRDSLSRGLSSCTFECRSALLGALIQWMYSLRLISFHPRPADCYPSLSLSSAIKSIRSIRSPVVYSPGYSGLGSRDPDEIWRLESERDPWSYSSRERRKRKKKPPSFAGSEYVECMPADQREEDEVEDVPRVLERHRCTLKQLLGQRLRAVEDGVVGLPLSDFVRE